MDKILIDSLRCKQAALWQVRGSARALCDPNPQHLNKTFLLYSNALPNEMGVDDSIKCMYNQQFKDILYKLNQVQKINCWHN